LFNSIGYGTDAEALAMLREARRCSKALLLETVHRDEHVRNTGPGGVFEWAERDGVRVLVERWIEAVPGVSRATFRIQREGGRTSCATSAHRLFFGDRARRHAAQSRLRAHRVLRRLRPPRFRHRLSAVFWRTRDERRVHQVRGVFASRRTSRRWGSRSACGVRI